jgi:DNA-directed RNA polymerase
MSSNNAEVYISTEIRKKKLLLRDLRRNDADPDEVIIAQSEMDELLEKYLAISDGKVYSEKMEDIATDFCDEMFYELSKPDRDEVKLSRFYDLDATVSVVGGDRFVGKLACVQSITVNLFGALCLRLQSFAISR